MKVRFTPMGRAQFLAALDYIRADNPAAALALRRKAAESLSRLADFPELGALAARVSGVPFREIIVAPYRFFYRVKADTVWVVAVWHGAQLPDEPETLSMANKRVNLMRQGAPIAGSAARTGYAPTVMPNSVSSPCSTAITSLPLLLYDFHIDEETVMDMVTISPKFQVVIPKRIREGLDLHPGQKVQAIQYGGRVELVPVRSAREMRGFLRGIDTTVPREADRL